MLKLHPGHILSILRKNCRCAHAFHLSLFCSHTHTVLPFSILRKNCRCVHAFNLSLLYPHVRSGWVSSNLKKVRAKEGIRTTIITFNATCLRLTHSLTDRSPTILYLGGDEPGQSKQGRIWDIPEKAPEERLKGVLQSWRYFPHSCITELQDHQQCRLSGWVLTMNAPPPQLSLCPDEPPNRIVKWAVYLGWQELSLQLNMEL